MNAHNPDFTTEPRDLARECYQLLDGATALGFMASQLRDISTDAPLTGELRDTMAFLMDQMSDRVSVVMGAALVHFETVKRSGIRSDFAQLVAAVTDARAETDKALDGYALAEKEHGFGSLAAKVYRAEHVDEVEDRAIEAERALAKAEATTLAELVAKMDILFEPDCMLPEVGEGIKADVARFKARGL